MGPHGYPVFVDGEKVGYVRSYPGPPGSTSGYEAFTPLGLLSDGTYEMHHYPDREEMARDIERCYDKSMVR